MTFVGNPPSGITTRENFEDLICSSSDFCVTLLFGVDVARKESSLPSSSKLPSSFRKDIANCLNVPIEEADRGADPSRFRTNKLFEGKRAYGMRIFPRGRAMHGSFGYLEWTRHTGQIAVCYMPFVYVRQSTTFPQASRITSREEL